MSPADAFLLVDHEGRYWTGTGWSYGQDRARRFCEEPDPFSRADGERARLERSGRRCVVLYVPRSSDRKSR